MPPLEPSAGTDDSDAPDAVIRNLREQIRELEIILLRANHQLAIFEPAAVDRLRVIEQLTGILHNRDTELAQLRRELENLRQRVAEFEAVATERLHVIQNGARVIEELTQDRDRFATAASERLHALEQGQELLRAREKAISSLQQQLEDGQPEAPLSLERQAAIRSTEYQRLAATCSEAQRSIAELAARERALAREILELRQEGLLNSIIRRARSLSS